MRNGVLLAEDTPNNIMRQYEVSSVEDAFLILSQRQGIDDQVDNGKKQLPPNLQRQSSMMATTTANGLEIITSNDTNGTAHFDLNSKDMLKQVKQDSNTNTPDCIKDTSPTPSWLSMTRGRLKALMVKNFIQLFRQPS